MEHNNIQSHQTITTITSDHGPRVYKINNNKLNNDNSSFNLLVDIEKRRAIIVPTNNKTQFTISKSMTFPSLYIHRKEYFFS